MENFKEAMKPRGSEKEAQIRYMAVDENDTRENAVGFYRKNGYRVIGKSYLLFGEIQHYKMRKEL